jgi:hypothetical protein
MTISDLIRRHLRQSSRVGVLVSLSVPSMTTVINVRGQKDRRHLHPRKAG